MEINTHLMFESIAIERAKANGTSISDVPTSHLTPFTPFQASRADLWINGLWFTSLALSLTTALMAVLTKQWIHQYLSVPSGTPQDRCRIRQFRYMSLENWHVPVIIGLLPVLMHVALGVFLGGLVLYLCSFSKPMAGVIGSIAAGAFLVYTATNLLPIFKSDCPYKTPLTLHCYDLSLFAWPKIKAIFRFTWKVESPKEYKSLKSLEQENVKNDGGNMDVHCLTWLYNMSSNSSVQRVVMQALSNIPLAEVPAIHQLLPSLSAHIRSTLADYVTPDRQLAWERLFRALNRFDDWDDLPPLEEQKIPTPNSLSDLFHDGVTELAIAFLREQIVEPTVEFDALSWARILRNALWEGTHWLDVHDNNSKVWTSFRDWFLSPHVCHKGVHERVEVWAVDIPCDTHIQWKDKCVLSVVESNGLYAPYNTTSDGANLKHSIQSFLYPFMCRFLTSNVLDSDDIPRTLPDEIRLHLSLLLSASTLETSGPYNPETKQKAPLGKLIDIMRVYVDINHEGGGWQGGTLAYHAEVTSTVFTAFYAILNSEYFETIRLRDRQDMLHPMIRALVLDGKLREVNGTEWMTERVVDRIISTTFADPSAFVAPVVAEILDYYLFCHSTLGQEVYRQLLSADWAVVADRESVNGPPKDPAEKTHYAHQYIYPFLISSFVDGLEFLKEDSPALHQQSLDYISLPINLFAITKILVLGDLDSRTRMWKLASLIERDTWGVVLDDLELYLASEDASARYEEQVDWLQGNQPFHLHCHPTWPKFEQIEGFVAQFRKVICEEGTPFPLVTPIYSTPKQIEVFFPTLFFNLSSSTVSRISSFPMLIFRLLITVWTRVKTSYRYS